MTIAVDFDGTIVEHRYPAIGKEIPFAIETLKRLADDGHKLILWSAREGKLLEDAIEFCHERGLDFYAVNADLPEANWEGYLTTRKLRVDCFIDDRNLGGLPDWATIYRMVSRNLTFGDLLSGSGREELLYDDEDGSKKKGLFARLKARSEASRSRLTHRSSRHHRSRHHHW